MEDVLTYQFLNPADVIKVSELASCVFNEFVAPQCSPQGVREFQSYIQPTAFLARSQANYFTLIAATQNTIVGMIEVRDYNHISLLFVAPDYHRKGIAKELCRKALQVCRVNKPELSEVSVNSSSYAIPIYEKLGFHQIGDWQIRNGIGFIPMILKLFS